MAANPIAKARMNPPNSDVGSTNPASTSTRPRLRSADYAGTPASASTGTPTASPIRVEQAPVDRNNLIGTVDFHAQRTAPASLGTVNTPGSIAKPPAIPKPAEPAAPGENPFGAPKLLTLAGTAPAPTAATKPPSIPTEDELKKRLALR